MKSWCVEGFSDYRILSLKPVVIESMPTHNFAIFACQLIQVGGNELLVRVEWTPPLKTEPGGLTKAFIGWLSGTPCPGAVLVEWLAHIAVYPGSIVLTEANQLVFFIRDAFTGMAITLASGKDTRGRSLRLVAPLLLGVLESHLCLMKEIMVIMAGPPPNGLGLAISSNSLTNGLVFLNAPAPTPFQPTYWNTIPSSFFSNITPTYSSSLTPTLL